MISAMGTSYVYLMSTMTTKEAYRNFIGALPEGVLWEMCYNRNGSNVNYIYSRHMYLFVNLDGYNFDLKKDRDHSWTYLFQ